MNHPYAISNNPTSPRDPSRAGGQGSTSNTTSSTRSPPSTSSTPNTPSSSGGGSVNRKLVIDPIHGHTREETRDERRARKDRERQVRDSASTTSTAVPSSSRLPPSNPTSSSSSTSTSSKSVLTIALQRAQSAVLLDSANNFPAAISAYSQSVRLLKEVMARVESKGVGGIEMERKGSTGSSMSILSSGSSNLARRENETVEEWEKRKIRWEKKEKAKADEARRLRVIHDTYEDRIKMLLAMNPSLASSVSPTVAAAVLPNSSSNPNRLTSQANGNPPSPTAASMRFHRRRSSTELQSQPRQPTHRSTPSSSSSTSASRPTSPSLAHVGQAMLSSDLTSSPISPSAPSASSLNGIPRIAQLPVISPSNSLQNRATPLDTPYSSYLGPSTSQSRPLSTASDATAKALPLSGNSTPTIPTTNPSRTSAPAPPPTTSLPPPPPDHPPPPIPTVNRVSEDSGSADSGDGSDEPVPVTAIEFGHDWPREEEEEEAGEVLNLPVVDRDPLQSDENGSPRPPSFPTTTSNGPVAHPMSSTHSSPMRRGSSASAVYTLQSARQPTNSFSSVGGGGIGGGTMSSVSMSMRRTMSSEGSNPSSILRPARSASLASQGGQGQQQQLYSSGMVPSLSAGSHHSTNSSFSIGNYARSVTATPEDGTGSQRRLAGGLTTPVPGEGGGSGQHQEHLEATIVVRAPSQESYRSSQGPSPGYDEMGNRTSSSGGGGGGGFGSLPGRLRALSQPNQKRPKIPINAAGTSWISDLNATPAPTSPPVPPLLSQNPSTTSSNSNRHHAPSLSISSTTTLSTSRKPSVPTPTSLNAPPFPSTLGRSNSSSSVGSSASGRYSDRSLPPPVPSTAATSLSQHPSATPHSTFGGIPTPPTRSSASSRDTVLSIPPVRRPFHLMRLVLATMPSSSSPPASRSSVISLAPTPANQGGGGYLSEKLYVPSQIWSIPGSKLVSLETKVRMMEIVLSSLAQLSQVGQSLLSPALANTARNSGSGGERWCIDEASRFMRELENFEGVVEGVQNTLAKKLGGGLINPTGGGIGSSAFNDKEFGGLGAGVSGKDVGGGGGSGSGKDGRKGSSTGGQFASWSSKFQRGFDRVTNANGVSTDSQAHYVETIARLFRQSQCIDHHLALLLLNSASSTAQPEGSAYALLPVSERHRLERQLRRASEFFGTVVCRFVMKDVGLLLDKYVKRGGAWLTSE
ncbi:uncharacterized protein JCM6883_001447 [Sporobolomyces salmoneus]|uniref:uncharacterized protein n=1 Tax=Sporobolomyces salmoneus TaxID=183962 RepID=UPI003174A171